MQDTQFDLLHIGLGKCMSTSLQHIWRASDNYTFHESLPLTRAINGHIFNNPDIDFLAKQINIDGTKFIGDSINILSNEEFTFSFISIPGKADYFPIKQELLLKVFAPRARKILIIVRDPIDWLKSAHAQSIHQGLHGDFNAFYHRSRALLFHLLDFRRLIERVRQWNDNIVVMPMEAYLRDADRFWIDYETLLELARPTQWANVDNQSNITNKASIGTASKLNDILDLLHQMVRKNMDIPHPNENIQVQSILNAVEIARSKGTAWALKRFDAQDLALLNKKLAHTSDEGFRMVSLDVEMKDHLVHNFIEPLEDFMFTKYQNYLNDYKENLSFL